MWNGALKGLLLFGGSALLVAITWTVARHNPVTQAQPAGVTAQQAAERNDTPPASERLLEALAARLPTQDKAPSPAIAGAAPTPEQSGVPENFEELVAFNDRVNSRAQQIAELVRTQADMERVLAQVEQEIAQSRRVNAFHVKSSFAAVRAAYRDRPEAELEARLLELDRRLTELSAKYDPSVRGGAQAGAERAQALN